MIIAHHCSLFILDHVEAEGSEVFGTTKISEQIVPKRHACNVKPEATKLQKHDISEPNQTLEEIVSGATVAQNEVTMESDVASKHSSNQVEGIIESSDEIEKSVHEEVECDDNSEVENDANPSLPSHAMKNSRIVYTAIELQDNGNLIASDEESKKSEGDVGLQRDLISKLESKPAKSLVSKSSNEKDPKSKENSLIIKKTSVSTSLGGISSSGVSSGVVTQSDTGTSQSCDYSTQSSAPCKKARLLSVTTPKEISRKPGLKKQAFKAPRFNDKVVDKNQVYVKQQKGFVRKLQLK